MKKLISIALACMMALSMIGTAAAAEKNITNGSENTSGKITISGAHVDENGSMDAVYAVYKMLHLESYNAENGKEAYSYVAEDAWENFFVVGEGKNYFAISDEGYYTWSADKTDEKVVAFTKAALKYAQENAIPPVRSTDPNVTPGFTDYTMEGTTIVFEDLSMGYYLVDSNVGALCGLTTTNPVGRITAKNAAPGLNKLVQEDSAVESGSETNSWFEQNTADIGQWVKYDLTINVHAGAQNYVVHDTMSEGLTFYNNGMVGPEAHGILSVIHYSPETGIRTALVEDSDYTLTWEEENGVNDGRLDDGCAFELAFDQDFCDGLESNDKIYIVYDAKLNEKAVIGDAGNPNEAKLEYGEGHSVTDQTITRTYGFDLVKTNDTNKLIDGAQFKIYNVAEGGTPIDIVLRQQNGTVYRKASTLLAGEVDVNDIITVTNGKVTVEGFDNGTYYLEEVKAPDGYNKLSGRVRFTISDGNLNANIVDGEYIGNGIQVQNSTGAKLPETGASGTAIFIGFGAALVIGTGLLLVTKKRMSMIED